jgi:hypothetical protein
MIVHAAVETLLIAPPMFCFGYPFVMAWYWMAGACCSTWSASDLWRR